MVCGVPIGSSIEAAGTLASRASRDQNWVYAGISLIRFKDNPDGLVAALQAACASTEGVMVFDLSHEIEPMWPIFKQAFSQPRKAPHQMPQLINDVRLARAKLDKKPHKDPTVVIPAGSAGTGQ